MTKQAYEYNVFDADLFTEHQEPGLIAVTRYYLGVTKDGERYTTFDPTDPTVYVYAPDGLEFDEEDIFYDFDASDLPWFVPLLDFDKED